MSQEHHPLVQLARAAIEAYVREGRVLLPDEAPAPVDDERAGVFVTIHTRSTGELRGCIGTIQATETSLAQETIRNAISAATRDPRFPAMSAVELAGVEIDVSVLHAAEKIESIDELDPQQYGVIVQCGHRRGLMLPAIAGIDDAEMQVDIARQKAWIAPDEKVDLHRFRVDRYL